MFRPLMIIMCSLTLTACVTHSEKEKLENNIFDLRTRLLQLESTQKGGSVTQKVTSQTLATSTSKVERLELELRRIKGTIDTLNTKGTTETFPDSDKRTSNDERLKLIEERLEKLEDSQKILIATIDKYSLIKDKSPKKSPTKTANQIDSFARLEKAFRARRYKSVAESSTKVLSKITGKQKREVLYMAAESMFKLGQLRDAALRYDEFIAAGGKKRLPHAKMRMGDCFRHLGDKATAKLYYQDLVKQFPSTAEAKKAKDRLMKL